MASTNNALNNNSTNPSGIASSIQTFDVINNDNSGTSSANFQIQVGGDTTTGDPQIRYTISGGNTWSMGPDNSISDSFSINPGTSVVAGGIYSATTGGINSWSNQYTGIGILTSNATDKTGAGTAFNIGAATAPYTYIIRRASTDFSLGVFTLTSGPNASAVLINGSVTLTGCTVNTGIQIRIVTSNRTYAKTINRPAASTDTVVNICAICDMDAADTAKIAVVGTGEAGNTDDLVGGTSTAKTFMTVYLMA